MTADIAHDLSRTGDRLLHTARRLCTLPMPARLPVALDMLTMDPSARLEQMLTHLLPRPDDAQPVAPELPRSAPPPAALATDGAEFTRRVAAPATLPVRIDRSGSGDEAAVRPPVGQATPPPWAAPLEPDAAAPAPILLDTLAGLHQTLAALRLLPTPGESGTGAKTVADGAWPGGSPAGAASAPASGRPSGDHDAPASGRAWDYPIPRGDDHRGRSRPPTIDVPAAAAPVLRASAAVWPGPAAHAKADIRGPAPARASTPAPGPAAATPDDMRLVGLAALLAAHVAAADAVAPAVETPAGLEAEPATAPTGPAIGATPAEGVELERLMERLADELEFELIRTYGTSGK
jgi:hypothetical protein